MALQRRWIAVFLSVCLTGINSIHCADPNISGESETEYIKLEDLVRQEILTYFKLILNDNENELNSLLLAKDSNGRNNLSSPQTVRNIIPQDNNLYRRRMPLIFPNDGPYMARDMTMNSPSLRQPYQNERGNKGGIMYQNNNGHPFVPEMNEYYLDDEYPSYEFQSPDNRVQYIDGYIPRTSIFNDGRQYGMQDNGGRYLPGMGSTRYALNNEPIMIQRGRGNGDSRKSIRNRGIRIPVSSSPSESYSVGNDGLFQRIPMDVSNSEGFPGNMQIPIRRKGSNLKEPPPPQPLSEPLNLVNDGSIRGTSMKIPNNIADNNIRSQDISPPPSESLMLINDGSFRGKPIKISNFRGFFDNMGSSPLVNAGGYSQNLNMPPPPSEPLSLNTDGSVLGSPMKRISSRGFFDNIKPSVFVNPGINGQSQDLQLPSPKSLNLANEESIQGQPLGDLSLNDLKSPAQINLGDLNQNQGMRSFLSPSEPLNLVDKESTKGPSLRGLFSGQPSVNINKKSMDLPLSSPPQAALDLANEKSVQGLPMALNSKDFSDQMNPLESLNMFNGGSILDAKNPLQKQGNVISLGNNMGQRSATPLTDSGINMQTNDNPRPQMESSTMPNAPNSQWGRNFLILQHPMDMNEFFNNYMKGAGNYGGMPSGKMISEANPRIINTVPRNQVEQPVEEVSNTNPIESKLVNIENGANMFQGPELQYSNSQPSWLQRLTSTQKEAPIEKAKSMVETNPVITTENSSGTSESAAAEGNKKLNKQRKYKILVVNDSSEIPANLKSGAKLLPPDSQMNDEV